MQALEQALAFYRDMGDRLGQANALATLGIMRRATAQYQDAARVLEQALEISHDIGYRIWQVTVLIGLGTVRRATGDNPGAAQALERAVVISREIGDPGAEAEILNETLRSTMSAAIPAGPQSITGRP